MAQIKTYCRIKPTNKISSFFDWDEDKVCIGIRTAGASGNSFDRTRTSTITHDTEFSHVFGPTVTQAEIFDVVASNIVEGCLAGYNGTIFAYGQTGSGKTYTIEGGSRTYADRGVAPRALSTVYQSIQKLTSSDVTIHVSYMEIYQETGYDLLNPTARMSGVVAHLPKVSVRDGPGNSCIIRNLSTHIAADENIAQNLLHQGRVSRRIAETSSNQRSSRSHAIFTIYLTQHDRKSDVIRKSKLHLVDLAGSERAAKSGIKGNQLAEAKSINLSLHHLEGVIIALQKMAQSERRDRRQRSSSAGPYRQKRISSASSSRSLPYDRRSVGELANPRHVPYRNSLLTMLLKDSLGGNCLTAMVATLSVQDINIGESLSTCRFAQRVACIKNHASRNEELDDKMIIKRLRKRVLELEKEIKNMKQGIQSPCKETDNVKIQLDQLELEPVTGCVFGRFNCGPSSNWSQLQLDQLELEPVGCCVLNNSTGLQLVSVPFQLVPIPTDWSINDRCVPNPCQNNGSCYSGQHRLFDGDERYYCSCPRGTAGPKCEIISTVPSLGVSNEDETVLRNVVAEYFSPDNSEEEMSDLEDTDDEEEESEEEVEVGIGLDQDHDFDREDINCEDPAIVVSPAKEFAQMFFPCLFLIHVVSVTTKIFTAERDCLTPIQPKCSTKKRPKDKNPPKSMLIVVFQLCQTDTFGEKIL
ncbi:kinesin-like protein KIF9 [Anneissia japonica]|uniref:kinesin-like protein KIF9 n=1 Tax=Anneissia japonica TaxID=1529436 RepID=UPI0014256149|nr:kinesin-like protein KIF9 [Anneissia japonica]